MDDLREWMLTLTPLLVLCAGAMWLFFETDVGVWLKVTVVVGEVIAGLWWVHRRMP